METNDRPNEDEAARALSEIDAAKGSLRPRPPAAWYFPSLAALVAITMLAQVLPNAAAIPVALAAALGIGVVSGLQINRSGVRYRIEGRVRRDVVLYVGVALGLVLAAAVLDLAAGLWWSWLVAAPLAGLAVLLVGVSQREGRA